MDEIDILQIGDLVHHKGEISFYANTIPNHLLINHSRIEKPHKHNFYTSMIFTAGSGTHEIDFNRYIVKPGTVFTLAPGQTHSWELSDDINGYIFFHNQEFFDLFFVRETLREYPVFRSIFFPNGICLSDEHQHRITDYFKRMLEEVKRDYWRKDMMLVNLTVQFYIEINRVLLSGERFQKTNSPYNLHFQRFEDLLEQHFIQEKSALFYAEKLNLSPKHLNRICKATVNQTTTEVIWNRVLLETKRMLIYSRKNFAEIASVLGCDDYSYFSKVFKRKTGATPKDFLKHYE